MDGDNSLRNQRSSNNKQHKLKLYTQQQSRISEERKEEEKRRAETIGCQTGFDRAAYLCVLTAGVPLVEVAGRA
jgi:hypothetical protein